MNTDFEIGLLTVAAAKDSGLFAKFQSVRNVHIPFTIWVARSDDLSLTIHAPRDAEIADEFPLSDSRMWFTREIRFDRAELKFGKRDYFICPITAERCTKLFFYRGIIASKRAFKGALKAHGYRSRGTAIVEMKEKMLGTHKPRRWSARNRSKYLSELEWAKDMSEDLDRRLETEKQRSRRQKAKAIWESMARSTTKGLDEGQGLVQSTMHQRLLQRSEAWLIAPAPARIFRPPVSPDVVTNFRELDIRILLARGRLNEVRPTSSRLWAPFRVPDEEWVILHVVPSRSAIPSVIIEFWTSPQVSEYQKLEVSADDRSERPRRFICPVTGLSVDVLYLRDGMFASRHAHKLKFPPGGKKKFILDVLRAFPE